jgi:class 3 adenylate cyclase
VEPSSSIPASLSFSELGTIHLHIDGGMFAVELVKIIVETLNREGFPSKLTPIVKAVPGPQRDDVGETYESHTPGDRREELDYFSTTRLTMDSSSREKLREVLESLSKEKGIVIEAEQVIGKGGEKISWSDNMSPDFFSSSVGFKRAPTLPIEVHYACDIPKESAWRKTPPLDLDSLLEVCSEVGIRVGGWFLFDDGGDVWAYRSNMFNEREFKEKVQKQRDDLALYLNRLGEERGFKCTVNALVERSLGVWKTPLATVGHSITVQELARWEEDHPNLRKFWVIAPNFLGDIDQNFRRAMVRNFRRDVEYTYFLHSFADVQRLRHFAKSLSETEDLSFIFENITVVLLNRDLPEVYAMTSILHGEYFIANPPLSGIHQSVWSNTQGYKLRRSRDKREIIGGRTMLSSEIENIVGKLRPLLENEIQGLRIPMDSEDASSTFGRAVIYTDLSGSTKLQEKLGDDTWAQVLLEYDYIVANEVSKLGGEVVKNLGDGYLLIFDQADVALRCAQRLQLALNEHNMKTISGHPLSFIPNQKIALDFGPVSRVMRAQGFDLTGKALSRCARLMEKAIGGQVLMLNTFREQARAASHNWVTEKTHLLYTIKFEGLEGTYEVWDLRWQD